MASISSPSLGAAHSSAPREFQFPLFTDKPCKLTVAFSGKKSDRKSDSEVLTSTISKPTLLKVYTKLDAQEDQEFSIRISLTYNDRRLKTYPTRISLKGPTPFTALRLNTVLHSLQQINRPAFDKLLASKQITMPQSTLVYHAIQNSSGRLSVVEAREFQFSVLTDQPCKLGLNIFRNNVERGMDGNPKPTEASRDLIKSTVVKVLTPNDPTTKLQLRLSKDQDSFGTDPEFLTVFQPSSKGADLAAVAISRDLKGIKQYSINDLDRDNIKPSEDIKPPEDFLMIDTINANDTEAQRFSQKKKEELPKRIEYAKFWLNFRPTQPKESRDLSQEFSFTFSNPVLDNFPKYPYPTEETRTDSSAKETKKKSAPRAAAEINMTPSRSEPSSSSDNSTLQSSQSSLSLNAAPQSSSIPSAPSNPSSKQNVPVASKANLD